MDISFSVEIVSSVNGKTTDNKITVSHKADDLAEKKGQIPQTVWALGFVSLFMDISSEIIHSLLPVFLVSVLGASVGMVGLVGVLFTLARFSEAFLLLRAQDIGLRLAMIPLILVVMNIAYSLTAFPAGKLSDRIGRKGLMACGLLVLIAADLLLGMAGTLWQVFLGTGLWGLHLGLTQGLLSAWIADAANPDLRGTAFGVFSLCNGMAILIASVLAGWLWQQFSPGVTFFSGAFIAAAALLGFMLIGEKGAPEEINI